MSTQEVKKKVVETEEEKKAKIKARNHAYYLQNKEKKLAEATLYRQQLKKEKELAATLYLLYKEGKIKVPPSLLQKNTATVCN